MKLNRLCAGHCRLTLAWGGRGAFGASAFERIVRRHLLEASAFEMLSNASYRPESGVSPAFEIAGAASADARKRISALAASGWRTVLVSVPAKKITGWSSAGIAPMKVVPGTWI